MAIIAKCVSCVFINGDVCCEKETLKQGAPVPAIVNLISLQSPCYLEDQRACLLHIG